MVVSDNMLRPQGPPVRDGLVAPKGSPVVERRSRGLLGALSFHEGGSVGGSPGGEKRELCRLPKRTLSPKEAAVSTTDCI